MDRGVFTMVSVVVRVVLSLRGCEDALGNLWSSE